LGFLSKAWLPTPIDKMFIVVEAAVFTLASLLADYPWGCVW
jgi:hypothetical protein